MPRVKTDAAIRRPDLAIAVFEYSEQAGMGFIANELFPIRKVGEKEGSFPVIPKEAMLKVADLSRAPRGGYHRDDWTYERGKYTAQEYGHEEPMDDVERAWIEDESPGMADYIATERSVTVLNRVREKRVADMCFSETYLTGTGVTNEWDDADNATPIEDVKTGKLAVRSACGMLPDTLVIAYSTYSNLLSCAEIIDRIKYTYSMVDMEKMTPKDLARIFNIERVLVAGAVYDSAGEGLDASIADLWSNEYALLAVTAKGVDPRRPCLGRSYLYTKDSPTDPMVEQYREEQIRSDIFRVRHYIGESFMQSVDSSDAAVSEIYKSCSYLMKNITT